LIEGQVLLNIAKFIFYKLRKDGFSGLLFVGIKTLVNFKSRGAWWKVLQLPTLENRFSEIYGKNLWSSQESLSGPGSELAATESLRGWLVENIPTLEVKAFVDAPCGDFNWMQHVVQLLEVEYLGMDIVPVLIEKNNQVYSNASIRFKVGNICQDTIPDCDLIMVRDCLFHLSYDDINEFLKNLSGVDYKYLLTTTHVMTGDSVNSDIISGDFRQIDLFSRPFNFDVNNVLARIPDVPIGEAISREMILVEKRYVPTNVNLASDPV
jgi:hypothetical protein